MGLMRANGLLLRAPLPVLTQGGSGSRVQPQENGGKSVCCCLLLTHHHQRRHLQQLPLQREKEREREKTYFQHKLPVQLQQIQEQNKLWVREYRYKFQQRQFQPIMPMEQQIEELEFAAAGQPNHQYYQENQQRNRQFRQQDRWQPPELYQQQFLSDYQKQQPQRNRQFRQQERWQEPQFYQQQHQFPTDYQQPRQRQWNRQFQQQERWQQPRLYQQQQFPADHQIYHHHQQPRQQQQWNRQFPQQERWQQQMQEEEEELHYQMGFPPVHQQTYQHREQYYQQGRLMTPERELRNKRIQKFHLLREKYREGDLRTVFALAEQARQDQLLTSPLLELINDTELRKFQKLTGALYDAFLQSPEAIPYADRAQLLYPAIARAFQAGSNSLVLSEVQSLCWQINKSLDRFDSPDRKQQLGDYLHWKFLDYLHDQTHLVHRGRLDPAVSVIKIQEMAAAIRQSGCYPAPLADTLHIILRLDLRARKGMSRALALYQAFIDEPAERSLFTDRPHVYFPWMLEHLDPGKKSYNRTPIVKKLFQMYTEPEQRELLPDFMITLMQRDLPLLFNISCIFGDFATAQQIWDHRDDEQLIRHKKKKMTLKFTPKPLLLFSLHSWATGQSAQAIEAKKLMYGRVRFINYMKAELEREIKMPRNKSLYNSKVGSRELKAIRLMLGAYHNMLNKRLIPMNNCFRELMENPMVAGSTRKRCEQILEDFVMRDLLRKKTESGNADVDDDERN